MIRRGLHRLLSWRRAHHAGKRGRSATRGRARHRQGVDRGSAKRRRVSVAWTCISIPTRRWRRTSRCIPGSAMSRWGDAPKTASIASTSRRPW